jgi:UDP-glucuronate 4-epimerase
MGMKLLVTGGSGFIGSNVVRTLAPDHDVVVLDNFCADYDPQMKQQNLHGVQAEIIRGDIRDAELLESIVSGGIDRVVHLAARAGVRESMLDPDDYESVNVGGTSILLEVLNDSRSIPLVVASSSSVYGSRMMGPFRETDPVDSPESPYAATKRATELVCQAAHEKWGSNITCLRFFTVFGPRQRPGMAIAKFANQILAGEPLTVYGGGRSMRDYTFVGDAVDAIRSALNRPQGFNVINVGSGRPIVLGELVTILGDLLNRSYNVEVLPAQEGDVPLTHADISLARELLDWEPKTDLRDGLKEYLDWLSSDRPTGSAAVNTDAVCMLDKAADS